MCVCVCVRGAERERERERERETDRERETERERERNIHTHARTRGASLFILQQCKRVADVCVARRLATSTSPTLTALRPVIKR